MLCPTHEIPDTLLAVHPHKHYANYPPQKDRGTAISAHILQSWRGRRSDQAHALDIALRRSAKQSVVLTTELRGAFITHTTCGATGVEVLLQHQLPSLLQTQLLLILQRAQVRKVVSIERLH